MNIPLHVQIRKQINNFINKSLSKVTKNSKTKQYIEKSEIKSIIIIRPNYRIGNLIFLTPLINELYKNIPNAKIDIIVGMKLAGDILEKLPNIDKVISIPRELLLHPLDLYHFIKESRYKEYDLAINIMGSSTSSQIVTSFVNSKYKASFTSDRNWTKLTHVVEKKTPYKHMGLESLELIKLFNIALPKNDLKLDIKLTNEELITAKKDLEKLLSDFKIKKNSKKIAIFRNARFDKKIEDSWWEEWFQALTNLDQNIVVIDILSPDIPTKLNKNMLEYANKNLRVLGAFFKECDLYISADTGPMHLAAASDAKVLALFNKTDTLVYGALGDKNRTIDINHLSPKDVAQITKDFV